MEKALIPVQLTVTVSARDEAGAPEDDMRTSAVGTLQLRGDTWLLHYDEVMEDEGDHTRLTTAVHLKVSGSHVTLLRKGAYGMLLNLEEGVRYDTAYHTPYGDMAMSVYPTQVQCRMGADRGTIRLTYSLEMAGGLATVRAMCIHYERKGKLC